MPEVTFGGLVREGRLAKGLTQKELAAAVSKEDGDAISPQFMNDIELERRLPSRFVIDRIAAALGLDPLYLRVLAGQPPSDRPASDYPQERMRSAIRAYRRALGETDTPRGPSITARSHTR